MPISEDFLEICRECVAKCCKMDGIKVSEDVRERIIDAGYEDHFNKIKDGVFKAVMIDGRCPYLNKDGSCKIQEVKPNGCKAWPIILGYEEGELFYIVAKCPLYKHLTEKDIEQSKKEASKIPKKIVREKWKLSETATGKSEEFEFEEI